MHILLAQCDSLAYMLDEYWRCYIHQISYPPSHTVGTSKMGPDSDPASVVDPRSKSFQFYTLTKYDDVIFFSSMPSPVSGNSNAACVMIGEKGADLVKEDYSRIENRNY